MRKNFKLVSLFTVSAALAFGGMAVISTQDNDIATQTVEASVQTKINLPKSAGYTKSNVLKANTGKLRSVKKRLQKASMAGMKNNTFYDTNSNDDRVVDVTKLSAKDKAEISKYALAVINSARRQMSKKNWTYSKHAVRFADVVARNYNKDGMSVWSLDHDVAGIKRAAKTCGLNHRVGQVYEDEAGLPISDEFHSTTRTMKKLKEQIYFNVKQMLFGGYSGNDINKMSAYFEWEHAGDLLGLRSSNGYDARTKQFGLSFSTLDGRKISVHMIGVAKRYIQNYKKYNK